jgi:hypothetical protein
VDGVDAIKFFVGLAVERLAVPVHFCRLGFDELAALSLRPGRSARAFLRTSVWS